jgi:hypothetical protein
MLAIIYKVDVIDEELFGETLSAEDASGNADKK